MNFDEVIVAEILANINACPYSEKEPYYWEAITDGLLKLRAMYMALHPAKFSNDIIERVAQEMVHYADQKLFSDRDYPGPHHGMEDWLFKIRTEDKTLRYEAVVNNLTSAIDNYPYEGDDGISDTVETLLRRCMKMWSNEKEL